MKFSVASIALPALAVAAPLELEERQSGGCQPVSVFFARGTGEPGTNGAIVGPSLQSNLNSQFNNAVTYVPIPYAADNSGNVPGGSGPGTQAYLQQINQVVSQCPNTKVVLTGYSQGANLVHTTAQQYGKPIAAAVTFGDPSKSQVPAGCPPANYKTFCATGDPVCQNGGNIQAHLSYGSNTAEAAAFIKQATGGAAPPPPGTGNPPPTTTTTSRGFPGFPGFPTGFPSFPGGGFPSFPGGGFPTGFPGGGGGIPTGFPGFPG